MARYIDADKAKQEFNIGFGGVSHAVIANQIIDSIPTADVVEVKHAKWKRVKGKDYWTCSNCCTVAKSEYDEYCRHCGAKMDGEKRDT